MRLRTAVTLCVVGLLPVVACRGEEGEETQMEAAAADVMIAMPVSTSSEEARQQFIQGQHAMDMGRTQDAREHFSNAVELDPTFAFAHLNLVFTGTSLEESLAQLEQASANKETASEAERLLIEIAEESLEGDLEEQLTLAGRLVEVEPESPRAWMQLAGIQGAMNRDSEARQSLQKAIELAPDFAPAHMQIGNSYLFAEPRDLMMAEEHMQKAVAAVPNEPAPHDLLGDVYRMQGKLQMAAEEYTQAAELDPDNALPLQQRGHVNSFLGNYEEARADYDASIEMGENNEPANFAVYRAYVNVHAGDPQAAVDELAGLIQRIDAMDIPNPRAAKIFALSSQAQIAMHHGMFDVAEQAIQQRARLTVMDAEEIGTEEARVGTLADNAIWEGTLAAGRGDYETAMQKGQEAMALLEPIRDPTKNQPVHELMGLVSLSQGNYEEAVTHYEQTNRNDIYANYHHALALEGAGRTEEAQELFTKVANWNFNTVGLALVRKDAEERAS